MPFGVGPGELFVTLVVSAIFVVPVALIVLFARRVSRSSTPDPRAILADRLAQGVISRADFDAAMHALGFAETR